jgi:hypothetical protein
MTKKNNALRFQTMVLRLAYFMASISKKLLSRKISMWSVDRKFNFAEMVIFRHRAHLRTFAQSELSRPGGAE